MTKQLPHPVHPQLWGKQYFLNQTQYKNIHSKIWSKTMSSYLTAELPAWSNWPQDKLLISAQRFYCCAQQHYRFDQRRENSIATQCPPASIASSTSNLPTWGKWKAYWFILNYSLQIKCKWVQMFIMVLRQIAHNLYFIPPSSCHGVVYAVTGNKECVVFKACHLTLLIWPVKMQSICSTRFQLICGGL